MRGLASLLLLAGCGRLEFESHARANDASIDGDPDAPVCAALFCDGFEDPMLAVWGTLVANGASAERDPNFGLRGASLHAVGPAGSRLGARYADIFPASPPPDQWVRAYIYVAGSQTLDVEPIELANAAHTYHLVFSLYDGGVDIHAHGIAGDFMLTAASTPPRDRWVCYELHVAIGAMGAVEMFRDGALVVAKTNIDTRPTADLTRLLVGVASKASVTPASLFIDEVAADTKRVGCSL